MTSATTSPPRAERSSASTPGRGRPRVPAPLAYLLVSVLLVSAAWALVLPPWQAPDEDHHFAYVQSLTERFTLPGDELRPEQSTEQRLATGRSNAEQTAAVPTTEMEWSPEAFARWQEEQASLARSARRNGGGTNPASTNPPLYYAYAAIGYTAAYPGDVFDRLYASRAISALLLLVTTTGAWLLAGEVFGRRRPLQLAVAAVTGLEPMMTFVSASVNPDSLLFALWALALWLGARILRRGLTVGGGVAFFAVVGLGTVTKATTLALLPAAFLVLVIGLWRLWRLRHHHGGRRGVTTTAVAAVTALAVLAGGWVAISSLLGRPALFQVGLSDESTGPETPLRLAASYLWQFYLPKLPFQQEFAGFPPLPVYDYWLKGAWGAFGALEVRLPEPLYLALALLTAGVLAAAVTAFVRKGDRRGDHWALVAFFAAVVLSLVAGLHWTEYRLLQATGGPFNQGRYVLPIVPLAGVAAAAALTLVPERWRGRVLALGVGALVALQAVCLAEVIGRFYA